MTEYVTDPVSLPYGFQYDVTTGRNIMDESEGVERYDVKVDGGAVLVAV